MEINSEVLGCVSCGAGLGDSFEEDTLGITRCSHCQSSLVIPFQDALHIISELHYHGILDDNLMIKDAIGIIDILTDVNKVSETRNFSNFF